MCLPISIQYVSRFPRAGNEMGYIGLLVSQSQKEKDHDNEQNNIEKNGS
jgi:hypothetical protein